MNLFLAIILILAALVAGFYLGAMLARRQFKQYVQENIILDENGLRTMMSNMGQKPSEAKIQQTLRQLKAAQKQQAKKK